MPKPNHKVNVYWEAAPLPPYDKLHYDERPALHALFTEKIRQLIPPHIQAQLLNIDAPYSDYDDVMALVNPQVLLLVPPPTPASSLVLPPRFDPALVQWIKAGPIHIIAFNVGLDPPNGTSDFWEFDVMYGGTRYPAILGARYQCTQYP